MITPDGMLKLYSQRRSLKSIKVFDSKIQLGRLQPIKSLFLVAAMMKTRRNEDQLFHFKQDNNKILRKPTIDLYSFFCTFFSLVPTLQYSSLKKNSLPYIYLTVIFLLLCDLINQSSLYQKRNIFSLSYNIF